MNSLNVLHMKVDLLLQNVSILIPFDVEVVPKCINLHPELLQIFLKLLVQLLSLFLNVELSHFFNSFFLSNLKISQLLSIVLGFFDSFINRHELFLTLHLLELGNWLDFNSFNSSIQPLVQGFNLLFSRSMKLLCFSQLLFLKLLHCLQPSIIELQQLLISYLNVLLELIPLNVGSKLRLVDHNVGFKASDLFHQVFVHLILMDGSKFLCEKLYLLFN